MIKVSVAFKLRSGDHDPYIGFTDGIGVNEFYLRGPSNYASSPPCHVFNGSHENTRVPTNAPPYSKVTMTFQPYRKYGSCYTAQNGGYENVGTFSTQLDITKGLSLTVKRDGGTEIYNFFYFHVEIIN